MNAAESDTKCGLKDGQWPDPERPAWLWKGFGFILVVRSNFDQ